MNKVIPSVDLIKRFLYVIENDILPLTQQGVADGNKLFGAALLRKSDNSLLLTETNDEMQSPLLHGEMHTLKRYHELDASTRPAPGELFLSYLHTSPAACVYQLLRGQVLTIFSISSVTKTHEMRFLSRTI